MVMNKSKVVAGEKHFTASVWILSRSAPKKMLLVHHKKLGKWQQPGGHIEQFENAIETAVREVKEETGLDISFLLKQIRIIDEEGSFLPVPRFFMEQTIPANNEDPRHFHLDLNYVVQVPEQKIKHNYLKTRDIGWFTKEEILKLLTHADTKVVVGELM